MLYNKISRNINLEYKKIPLKNRKTYIIISSLMFFVSYVIYINLFINNLIIFHNIALMLFIGLLVLSVNSIVIYSIKIDYMTNVLGIKIEEKGKYFLNLILNSFCVNIGASIMLYIIFN